MQGAVMNNFLIVDATSETIVNAASQYEYAKDVASELARRSPGQEYAIFGIMATVTASAEVTVEVLKVNHADL